MSKEAWGDEGNVPNSAEDTAMYQEYLGVLVKFEKWQRDFEDDVPNDETALGIESIRIVLSDFIDVLRDQLQP